jgi:hypothetical protein
MIVSPCNLWGIASIRKSTELLCNVGYICPTDGQISSNCYCRLCVKSSCLRILVRRVRIAALVLSHEARLLSSKKGGVSE